MQESEDLRSITISLNNDSKENHMQAALTRFDLGEEFPTSELLQEVAPIRIPAAYRKLLSQVRCLEKLKKKKEKKESENIWQKKFDPRIEGQLNSCSPCKFKDERRNKSICVIYQSAIESQKKT